MKTNLYNYAALSLFISFTACSDKNSEYDANGTFEATEITVSAEQNGKLLQFDIYEGDKVEAGALVALIDTTQLYLRAQQIGATKLVYANQRPDVAKQVAATRQQLSKAQQEYKRFSALAKDGAANQKQVDDAQNQVKVLQRQLEAQLASLQTSTNSLNAQMSTADIEKLQVADQLMKCHLKSPISGTVLNKYMECGEYAIVGKPVFKVADTEQVFLRAYLTTQQLKKVKLGQQVKVYADYGNNDRQAYDGTVSWISSKAEFTPKTVLTDDERADLVYAVKIAVKNDGYIKMGMYGEVKF